MSVHIKRAVRDGRPVGGRQGEVGADDHLVGAAGRPVGAAQDHSLGREDRLRDDRPGRGRDRATARRHVGPGGADAERVEIPCAVAAAGFEINVLQAGGVGAARLRGVRCRRFSRTRNRVEVEAHDVVCRARAEGVFHHDELGDVRGKQRCRIRGGRPAALVDSELIAAAGSAEVNGQRVSASARRGGCAGQQSRQITAGTGRAGALNEERIIDAACRDRAAGECAVGRAASGSENVRQIAGAGGCLKAGEGEVSGGNLDLAGTVAPRRGGTQVASGRGVGDGIFLQQGGAAGKNRQQHRHADRDLAACGNGFNGAREKRWNGHASKNELDS